MLTFCQRHRTLKTMGPMSEEARRALSELRADLQWSDPFSSPMAANLQIDEATTQKEDDNVNILLPLEADETMDLNSENMSDRYEGDSIESHRQNAGEIITDRQKEREVASHEYGGSEIVNFKKEKSTDWVINFNRYEGIVQIDSPRDNTFRTERQRKMLSGSYCSSQFKYRDLKRIQVDSCNKREISKPDRKHGGPKTFRSRGSLSIRNRVIVHPGENKISKNPRRTEVLKDDLDTNLKSSFEKLTLPPLKIEQETEPTSPSSLTKRRTTDVMRQFVDEGRMNTQKDGGLSGEFQTKRTVGYSLDTGYNSMMSDSSKIRIKNKSVSLDRVTGQKSCRDADNTSYVNASTFRSHDLPGLPQATCSALINEDCDHQECEKLSTSDNMKHRILHKSTSNHALAKALDSISPQHLVGNYAGQSSLRRGSMESLDAFKYSPKAAASAVISRATEFTARAVMEDTRLRDLALLKFQQQQQHQQPRQELVKPLEHKIRKRFRVSGIGYDCRYDYAGFGAPLPTVEDIERIEEDEEELVEEYRRNAVNKCEQWLSKYHVPSRMFSLF